jgi:hypothetical protein
MHLRTIRNRSHHTTQLTADLLIEIIYEMFHKLTVDFGLKKKIMLE